MEITGTLVMAAGTQVVPVDELSEEVRLRVQALAGDYAVSRPNSRTLARIIDGDAARLVEEFRKPTTVVQAIIRYCKSTKQDPEATLDAAFPMLERLVDSGLLVPAESPQAKGLEPLFPPDFEFAGTQVVACIQALEDTELYKVKTDDGQIAALKVMRLAAGSEAERMLVREAFILEHLDGTATPTLLNSGTEKQFRYLLLSWCHGTDSFSMAARLRSAGDLTGLMRLSVAILDAYAHLHAQNVIHSDVHTRNILVDDDCSVRLVDFGIARVTDLHSDFGRAPRGGVAYFFEPEYAIAMRSGDPPPFSSVLGEQYALAALLYVLITGRHYLHFSLERNEMLRQISEDNPLPFRNLGLQTWPAVESVLAKALAKRPANRFESVAAFAGELRSVGRPPRVAVSSRGALASSGAATQLLEEVLKRLDRDQPLLQSGLPYAPRTSINYGSAGVACALNHIARARENPALLSLADLWCQRAVRDSSLDDAWYCSEIDITPEIVGCVSPYHTESGVHFIKAQIAYSRGDLITQQECVNSFIAAASSSPCDNVDLTLGRSGTLLATAHLLSNSISTIETGALRDFGKAGMDSIWRQLDSYTPIPECHQIRYSGIAHGWAGMLYATLCWCRASGDTLPLNCGERLDQLAALASYQGRQARWKWIISSEPHNAPETCMAGWCNGSAGQVHLWLAAHMTFRHERYLALAEKAAWHVAETDTGNGSLCCGFSGQAYSLLALYRHTRDKIWLSRVRELANKAAIAYLDSPPASIYPLDFRPDSLYKGELGVATLAADLDHTDLSGQPAFEFTGS